MTLPHQGVYVLKEISSMNIQSPPFAIITGASRGIGAAYARALSRKGYDLMLVARDQERLQAVADDLQSHQKGTVSIEKLDLSQPGAATQLFLASRQHRPYPDLVINNAGFGMYGPFAAMPLSRLQEMCQLHIITILETMRLFLPSMIERKAGGIINVASIAGFLPIPYMAEYAATKAFLISLSEAVGEEVRKSGVTIQACCPGYTETDFHITAGVTLDPPPQTQTAQEVVLASLRALEHGHTRVPTWMQGRLLDLACRLLPRSMVIRLAGQRTLAAWNKSQKASTKGIRERS